MPAALRKWHRTGDGGANEPIGNARLLRYSIVATWHRIFEGVLF